VLIGKLIEFKTAQAATFADALDGLSVGMFFVDSSGRITHANAVGSAMIADGNVLRAPRGRIVASDPDVNRALQDTFSGCRHRRRGDWRQGRGRVAGRAATVSAMSLIVLPLSSGARRSAGVSYAAVAVLFVQKAALGHTFPRPK